MFSQFFSHFFNTADLDLSKNNKTYASMSKHELLETAKVTVDARAILALSHICYPNNKINSYMMHILLFDNETDSVVKDARNKIFIKYPYLQNHILHLKEIIDLKNFQQTQNILCCYIKLLKLFNYISSLDNFNDDLSIFIHKDFIRFTTNILMRKVGDDTAWSTANGVSSVPYKNFFNVMTHYEMKHEEYSSFIKDIAYSSPKLYGELALTRAAEAFSKFLIFESKLKTFVSKLAKHYYNEFSILEKSCNKNQSQESPVGNNLIAPNPKLPYENFLRRKLNTASPAPYESFGASANSLFFQNYDDEKTKYFDTYESEQELQEADNIETSMTCKS